MSWVYNYYWGSGDTVDADTTEATPKQQESAKKTKKQDRCESADRSDISESAVVEDTEVVVNKPHEDILD